MPSPKRFLFTVLPTNDLGLLTRSLPIAKELANRGHSILFSHPAKAPGMVIAEAGFANVPPVHPLYGLASGKFPMRSICSRIGNGGTLRPDDPSWRPATAFCLVREGLKANILILKRSCKRQKCFSMNPDTRKMLYFMAINWPPMEESQRLLV